MEESLDFVGIRGNPLTSKCSGEAASVLASTQTQPSAGLEPGAELAGCVNWPSCLTSASVPEP